MTFIIKLGEDLPNHLLHGSCAQPRIYLIVSMTITGTRLNYCLV